MLDFLLRQWLGRTVRQHAYSAARDAAFEHLSAAARPTPESTPPDRPADVGLVFNSSLEAGACEDRLSGVLAIETQGLTFQQGGLRGRGVVLVHTAGIPATTKGAELLIAGHQPRWVICAGFATALQPQLARGDFLLANDVSNADGQHLAIDLAAPADDANRKPRVHCGRLLTLEQAVSRAAEKESLGREHDALAADQQSFAAAEVCRREKTRFMSVRIISEALSDEPPRDVERLARKKTSAARWGATLGAIVHRPASLKDMLQAKEDSLAYADRLARFLESVIVQLTPEGTR